MQEKKGFDFKVLQRVVKMGMAHKLLFYSVLLIAILSAMVSIIRPQIVRSIVDDYITPKNHSGLIEILSILAGILLLEVILQFFLVYFANFIAQRVIKVLRTNLFKHLVNFKLSYFDKTPNGVLVTRSVSDIETVAQVFNDGILVILGDMMRIIFVVTAMYYIDWQISTIVLLILPLMIVITSFFQRALKKVYQAERTLVANLNSFVQERITGMNIVQLFNREENEFKKFKSINKDLRQAYIKTVFYFSVLFPVVEFISSITLASIIWFGGWYGNLTPGILFAFIMYTNMLIRPMRQVAERLTSIQRGLVGADRVFKILDADETIPDKGTDKLKKVKGEIAFKNVVFSYIPSEPILKNVTFEINPGDTIAIVGATGAGKSTIINLLNRYYEIDSGEILIDNKNIQHIDLENLRSHIAVVLQDVFLFNTNILHNITLGNTEITIDEVKQAAKFIGIHDFIEQLPNGYQTKVSERGSTLSVGQRQLISFLRAYVFKPEILILDEATSSIDTESEQLIQKATEKITKGRTSIVIAHRLATIQNADKIIVMGGGKVLEEGTHLELLEKGGAYKTLYEVQFSEATI